MNNLTDPLPIGCRARHDEIERRSHFLLIQFACGHKNSVKDILLEMEPLAALAVLACMMEKGSSHMYDIVTYFKAVA